MAWRRQTGLADLAQASAWTKSREDADPPSNTRPVPPKLANCHRPARALPALPGGSRRNVLAAAAEPLTEH